MRIKKIPRDCLDIISPALTTNEMAIMIFKFFKAGLAKINP